MDLSKYKLIIFDCDGTLVDTEILTNQLISDMMNEIGLDMSTTQSLKLFKGTRFKFILDYIDKRIFQPLDFNFEEEFRKRCKIIFENELKPIKGAEDFINTLKVPCCVASNGPKIKMKTSLAVTGLDKYFINESIFSAYDIDRFKPDPTLFLYAAKSFGIKEQDCLVFEDTMPGIDAAKAANMDICGIYHPNVNEEILDIGIKTIESYSEL